MEDKLTNNELKILMDNLTNRFDKFEDKFDKFIERMEENYVSKLEFKPYQKGMYIVGSTVLTALLLYGLDKMFR